VVPGLHGAGRTGSGRHLQEPAREERDDDTPEEHGRPDEEADAGVPGHACRTMECDEREDPSR